VSPVAAGNGPWGPARRDNGGAEIAQPMPRTARGRAPTGVLPTPSRVDAANIDSTE